MNKIYLSFICLFVFLNGMAQTKNLNSAPTSIVLNSYKDNFSSFPNLETKKAGNKFPLGHPEQNRYDGLLPAAGAIEIVAKRTATTTEYKDASQPGKSYLISALGEIHYKKNGQWSRIDARLYPGLDGQFVAENQVEPVGFNVKNKQSYIETKMGKFSFNQWTLSGVKSGAREKLAEANWSNITAGEDGLKVIDIFPGMDAEMKMRKGGIKTSFIVKSLQFSTYETLIFEDNFSGGSSLSFSAKEAVEFTGPVFVLNNNKKVLQIAQGIMHPLRGGKDDVEQVIYAVNGSHFSMIIPVSYLMKFEKSGVVIDPAVTGTTTLAASAILGSQYNSSCAHTLSCDYTTTATIPANRTVTELNITSSWIANAPCNVEDGSMMPIIGTCSPVRFIANPALAGSPGTTSGGANFISTGYLSSSCLPAPSCTDQSLTVGVKFFRGCKGATGCDDACIGAYNPIVFTFTSNTVEYTNATALTVPAGPFCENANIPVSTAARYGVPPYTYIWSTNASLTPSLLSSASGNVAIASAGSYTLYNKVTDACSNIITASSSSFTVNPSPTISGSLNVCIGLSTTLSGSATAHPSTPWTSSNTGVATISASGLVNTVAVGTTNITYMNSNGCSKTVTLSVNSLPTISGTLSACSGTTSTLSGSATPHATTPWASSNTGIATVSNTGVVTGVAAGTATITYMNTNGCTTTATFTVNGSPTISGTFSTCLGGTTTLTGSGSAHATTPWTSSNTAVATVSASGLITTLSAGATTITYMTTNGCTGTATFTVNAIPTISGGLNTCEGVTSTLTGSGTAHPSTPWSSSNTGVATISATGLVTGVAAGSTTITYMDNNGCTKTATLNVNTLPSISGTLSACAGQTSTLSGTATPHATTPWASSNTGVATVSSVGVVTAVAGGTTTITYMNTNGCIKTATFTVNALPVISGTLNACLGLSSTLTGTATAHATTPWASSNTAVATISATGVVTAVAAGSTTITYMNTNGCTQTATFTVNSLPTISGTLSACAGSTSTLTGSATPNATTPWASSNTGVATISNAGVVTGVAAGTTTITYTNTNGCIVTATFTVNALPIISGTLNACIGSSATLTGSATAHATTPWTSSNTAVATISSAGVITPVASGTTTITYMNTLGCTQNATFTVNPLPTITGTFSVCEGLTSTLAGSATAHTITPWTSSNTAVATVSATGVVTGVAAGTATITYMNTNGCAQTATFTVNALPVITGTLNACVGLTSTLTGTATAHATTPWASSNTGVATVSSAGVVTAVAAGTATITYMNTNGCIKTATFTVNALPVISGVLTACAGLTATLTGTATAHATTPWASSTPSVATISATGVVTAVAGGTTTITYMNTNGCIQTATFTVNPLPTISGTLSACIGASATLTGSATAHATTPWASSTPAVATISNAGVVTTVSVGTTTITYMNTNGCIKTATFTVNPLPTITGTLTTCIAATSTLTGSATPHATTPWTSSNTGVATISSAGLLTGVAAGTTTITYMNTNGCTQTATVTVNILPTLSGTLFACAGFTSTLTGSATPNATTPWASSSTGIATVSNLGVVTAVSGGTTTITYRNTNNCIATASFVVNPLPTITGTTNACVGFSSTLTGSATPDATTPWVSSSPAIATVSSAGVVTGLSAGNTTITYKNSNGCIITALFTVNPIPTAPTVTTPLNLCIGVPSVPLTASGISLRWYTVATGGTSSTSATPSTTAVGNTDYWVTQTSVPGCESPRAKLTVQVQPSPVVTIAALSPYGFIFCKKLSVTLKATSATAITWQWDTATVIYPGATKDSIAAFKQGIWGITVTDVYGCKKRNEVMVYRDSADVPVLSPTEKVICEESSALLTCSPGFMSYTFEWIKDGVYMSPTPKINIRPMSLPGTYKVRVTNNLGCIDTTNVSVVSLYPRPLKPVITKVDPKLTLSAGPYIYYQWYKNGKKIPSANASKYTYTANGFYYAEITDANGCLNNSDTVDIQGVSIKSQNLQAYNIKIFPNPASDIVNIESPVAVDVVLSDVVGKIVWEGKDVSQINIRDIANGTYIMRISDKEGNLIAIEKISKIGN